MRGHFSVVVLVLIAAVGSVLLAQDFAVGQDILAKDMSIGAVAVVQLSSGSSYTLEQPELLELGDRWFLSGTPRSEMQGAGVGERNLPRFKMCIAWNSVETLKVFATVEDFARAAEHPVADVPQPIEFELERIRRFVSVLTAEIRESVHTIASEDVNLVPFPVR